MSQREVEGLQKLQSIIDEIFGEIGSKQSKPDLATIKQYCEIIGEKNPVYFDIEVAKKYGYKSPVIPQGYLLTLFIPIVNEFFIKGYEKLFTGLIRGVIHTESEVVYNKPLLVGENYVLHLESERLEKKKGKKGEYFVWTFRAVASDEEGEEMAYDRHTFFLKI
ncbi:MAG: FAS1-like dehydratase domain-containing protein [Candidatus Jordarchaeum sp.]|uniref:FAS1-like dehydratase domain-containing protein n=1 Tax=Candidatus Jordarchaeum sp. TaxID=2823881 RepID=UPI004049212D